MVPVIVFTCIYRVHKPFPTYYVNYVIKVKKIHNNLASSFLCWGCYHLCT